MKKNFLLYLFMMAFSITFFSACGDDDDDDKGGGGEGNGTATTWKDGVGTFKKDGGSTVLKINGVDPETDSKSVTLATSGDNAKITLTNVVPDDATVEFDNIEMKKSDSNYTFSSEQTVGTTTVSIEGTLSGIPATKADAVVKTLDVKVTRKITSPIAGTWKLNFTEAGGDVYFDVNSGDAETDAAFAQLGAMLGGMMAQKVTDVTTIFGEDGIFDVNWVKQGETDPTVMPPTVKGIVGEIMYFASETQVFLTLKKSLMPMLEIALPALGVDIDIDALIELMVDKGDYYALPINMTVDGDKVSFYSEKEMLITVLPLVSPMLAGLAEQLPPEQAAAFGPLLENLPTILANAEKFNIGLNFVK